MYGYGHLQLNNQTATKHAKFESGRALPWGRFILLFPSTAEGHGQGLATSIPVSVWQGRVAPIIAKIRKANSLMLYQAASVAGGLRPSSYP